MRTILDPTSESGTVSGGPDPRFFTPRPGQERVRTRGRRRVEALATAAALAATVMLASAGSAHGADGTWERAWGKDVVTGGGTGFEVCTVAADCKVGVTGALGGELNSPWGVAADDAGNVYVADISNQRVQKFDADGTWERAWGKDVVTGGGTGFEVCTVAANCKSGQGFATGLGGELANPIDVDVDDAGNVYVADNGYQRIQKFDSDGTWERAWGRDVATGGSTGFEVCTVAANCKSGDLNGELGGEFRSPTSVAVDSAGDVYVTDEVRQRIQKFAGDGTWERAWGKDVIRGGEPGDLGTGFEICTVAADCQSGATGGLGGEFQNPRNVEPDGAGSVYVADISNQRVQKFDSDGTWERAWGKDVVTGGVTGFEICTVAADCKAGVGNGGLGGELINPAAVAVDGAGDVYVADADNRRVQKFDSSGTWERAWGRDAVTGGGTEFEICTVAAECKDAAAGGPGGAFAQFQGIAADGSGTVYAADTNQQRIQRFGEALCTITGTAANERLKGTGGNDVICGLGGNDRINGRGGSDILRGGEGDDELIGALGVDTLEGGAGDDDRANYAADATTEVDVDLSTGAVANDGRGFAETVAGVENVEGAKDETNTLTGDGADNKLIGGVLADELSGRGGADLLRGEFERSATGDDDALIGGGGADALFPGLGSNTIDGGAASDVLQYTGLGTALGVVVDNLDGSGTTTGAATDTFSAIENVAGTPNADEITVDWNGVASGVSGRDGDDTLSTADGDSLDLINGGAGANVCDDGGDGDIFLNC